MARIETPPHPALQRRDNLCHHAPTLWSDERSRATLNYDQSSHEFPRFGVVFIVGGLLGQRLMRGQVVTGGVKIGIISLGLGAVVLHAALLYTRLWTASGLNLALTPDARKALYDWLKIAL